jgi:hypothetical protein
MFAEYQRWVAWYRTARRLITITVSVRLEKYLPLLIEKYQTLEMHFIDYAQKAAELLV